jgi:plasmid stabilization system protein ParE
LTSRYVLTVTAESDVHGLLQYIADRDGVDRALHVLDHFELAFDRLSTSPDIGIVRHDLTGETLRWWIVLTFAVIYDPPTKPLTILRVLHSARHLEDLSGSERDP